MRDFLLNNVLPFWMEHAVDYEHGGILTSVDREGNVYDYEKNVWFAGRAMYTYSVAYNEFDKNEKYLEVAKVMYDFLPKCELDSTGRLPFISARDGRCIEKRRFYFSETFAAIGCAEYYLATGIEEAKERAEKYFDIAYSIYTADLNVENDPISPRPMTKSLGPSMILLSTSQVLRKLNKEKYDKIAKECADEILTHFIVGKGLLENVGLNGEFIDTQIGREVNPGHSLEAAWFLMAEGVYGNNSHYISKAKEIIDISMKLGYRDGGIIAFCDCDGKPSSQLEWDMKIWWPQCEAMIANRLAYAVLGDEKYLRDFEAIRDYCFARYPDPVHGEWYGYLHADGTVANTLKGNVSKGPFHLPRMLMLIDKLENGKTIL